MLRKMTRRKQQFLSYYSLHNNYVCLKIPSQIIHESNGQYNFLFHLFEII